MNLSELLNLGQAVEGATFSLPSDDHLVLVRDDDGVEISIRAVPATELDRKDREGDLLVVRWEQPPAIGHEALSRANAVAAVSVATTRRYENLHGKSEATFHRAQVLGTGLEPARLVKALAHDLGLRESIDAPPPVSLEDVLAQLNETPVMTAERELLLAVFRKTAPEPGDHYRRDGEVLRGPSSIGESKGGASPVEVTVRVDDLGFVRVRHERPVADVAELLPKLDQINAESSSEEALVGYHRAFLVNDETVGVEFSAAPSEIGTRSFRRKIRGLEIAVSSHLR